MASRICWGVRLCQLVTASSFDTVLVPHPWNNNHAKVAIDELAKIGSWVSYVGVGMAKGSMMD